MPARLFRRITSLFRLKKTLLFAITAIACTFFIGKHIAFADLTATDYAYYAHLFNGASLSYNQPIVDTKTNTVPGFAFLFDINFAQNGINLDQDALKVMWQHVQTGDDTFFIKSCLVTDQTDCAYGHVLYGTAPSASFWSKIKSGTYTFLDAITGGTGSIGDWALSKITGSNSVATNIDNAYKLSITSNFLTSGAIFQQAANGQYLQSQEVNVLVTNWYTADGSAYYPTGTAPTNFIQTKSRSASIWYCAKKSGDDIDPTGAYAVHDPNIQQFGSFCGGGSYFKVADMPGQITPPQTLTDATTQAAGATNADQTKNSIGNTLNLPECGIGITIPGQGTPSGTINGCAAQLAYGFYELVAWIAGLFGQLFDFFIGFSVSSATYSYPFVVTGWKVVRDISNVFFIIIMVYAGFSAVFDIKATSMKKVLPAIIINAVLINFSLFATRVAIDLSNVTARMFYSRMLVCDQTTISANQGVCPPAQAQRSLGGYWPLSEKIVSAFNPQQMFQNSTLIDPRYQQGQATSTAVTFNSQNAGNTSTVSNAREYANYFMIVSVIASVIMICVGIMFFDVTFLFLGRIVGLYLCMIFSPFAFLTRGGIPLVGEIKSLKWGDWVKELSNYAILAPLFIFFLYIIYSFLSTDFVTQIGLSASNSHGFFETLLTIAIPMLIIFFMVRQASKLAKGYAGDVGSAFQGFVDKTIGNLASFTTGAVLAVATDGASLAASRVASKATELSPDARARLQARQAQGGFGGWIAEKRMQASDWTQKQSFNIRDTGAYKKATGAIGIKTNEKVMGRLGFGTERTKGGQAGMKKRAGEKTKKQIESIKADVSKEEAVAIWNDVVQKMAAKQFFAQQKAAGTPRSTIKEMKKSGSYLSNDAYQQVLTASKQEAEQNYGKVTNGKQLTRALRIQYADSISKEKTGGQNMGADVARTSGLTGSTVASIVTGAGAIATGVGMAGVAGIAAGAATEDETKRKTASKYAKDEREKFAKKPRNERLEEENDKLKKELKDINEKLDQKVFAKAAEKTVTQNPANVGKSAEDLQKLIKEEIESLKENVTKANEVLGAHRQNLRNTFDELDLDVKRIDTEYTEALKKGNAAQIDRARRERAAAIAKRNEADQEYKDLDPKRKRDLENNINRNDSELEKIKEKEDGKKDADKGEAKKDDKK